jgi:hypothetical protein
MKIILFILVSLTCLNFAQAKNILYSNSNIQWLGRWNETNGIGKWSGWSGSQIVFKVHGTTSIVVNCAVIDPDNQNFCNITFVIDNSPANSKDIQLTTLAETYTGDRSGTIALPDTNIHTIMLRANGLNPALWGAEEKIIIKSFDIDEKGSIALWIQGRKKLQTIGDSWMAADVDWPRQMNRTKWQLYPVATDGLRASNMNEQYNFNYSGSSSDDPAMDDIIVEFGVNDYNAGVTIDSFQKDLNSLVNKIRLKQPKATIYLICPPNNLKLGKYFGKYSNNIQKIANQYKNVYYVSTLNLEPKIEWQADGCHLELTSKIAMANFIDSAITSNELSFHKIDTVITHVPISVFDTTYNYITISVLDMNEVTNILNLSGEKVIIKLYPNPIGEIVNLKTSAEIIMYEIYTLSGSLRTKKIVNGLQSQIDFTEFISGTYIMKIYTANGTISSKLVVQK